MEINIPVSEEEKLKVIEAITILNKMANIKYMSQAMIAEVAQIKATKVRAILVDLVKEERITQLQATENPRIQRFYYTVNPEQEAEGSDF